MSQFASAVQVPQAQQQQVQYAQVAPAAAVQTTILPNQGQQYGQQYQVNATATVIPQAQVQLPAANCETCPVAPTSQATYTRQRIAVFGQPQIISQDIDRCTGVPRAQTERVTAVFTTTPWLLDSSSGVDAAYQHFVPQSFQTL